MPKMVTELAQGNTFGRSADGGALSDSATRVFKVILNSPSEALDILSAIGVQIGDPYSESNPIPCVSVEGRADGESRLVRIVTVQYRTMTGDGGGGQDPGTQSPDVRPANFSTSTSLYEMPAYLWKRNGNWGPAVNPVGDRLDGITKFEPITTIRITQFSVTPGTVHQAYCGYVNSETMSLGGYMSCAPKTVMFRGVEATPHIESFGNMVYRGFMNSYEFAYRANRSEAPGASGDYGWDLAVPVTGFNCRAFNPAQPGNDKDPYGQPLKYEDYKLAKPLALPDEVQAGEKVRAMVRITNMADKTVAQNQSSQPIPLNEDGTPRAEGANPKVLIWRVSTQVDINLTSLLQLRLT